VLHKCNELLLLLLNRQTNKTNKQKNLTGFDRHEGEEIILG